MAYPTKLQMVECIFEVVSNPAKSAQNVGFWLLCFCLFLFVIFVALWAIWYQIILQPQRLYLWSHTVYTWLHTVAVKLGDVLHVLSPVLRQIDWRQGGVVLWGAVVGAFEEVRIVIGPRVEVFVRTSANVINYGIAGLTMGSNNKQPRRRLDATSNAVQTKHNSAKSRPAAVKIRNDEQPENMPPMPEKSEMRCVHIGRFGAECGKSAAFEGENREWYCSRHLKYGQ